MTGSWLGRKYTPPSTFHHTQPGADPSSLKKEKRGEGGRETHFLASPLLHMAYIYIKNINSDGKI